MDLAGIATVALAALTLLSVAVAVVALRRASADAKAARTAELSWNVYQAYDSRELREGRRALNTVSRKKPVPHSGKEFGDMYVTHTDKRSHDEEVSTGSIRRILRFYHQIGILLDKGLIDADFIFPLIGDGLNTSQEGIRVAVEWHPMAENPRTKRLLPGLSMKKQDSSLASIGIGRRREAQLS